MGGNAAIREKAEGEIKLQGKKIRELKMFKLKWRTATWES